jgi:hypothetical protein
VARYYLSVRYRDGPKGLAVDEEGDEMADEAALLAHVADTARDLMWKARITGVDWRTCTFEVTDETGQVVLTMPFAEAVQS